MNIQPVPGIDGAQQSLIAAAGSILISFTPIITMLDYYSDQSK